MDFDLTEEQGLLQDSVAKLLATSYAFDQRQAMRSAPGGYRRDMWRQFADLGLLALPFAEADGGLGGGAVDVMLLMEAFGRHLVLEPYLATVVLAGGCLRHAASEAQRAELLPALISGDATYALAHVEREARFDLTHVRTVARREGDDWILDGAKAFVTHGDSADRLVVSARMVGGGAGTSNIGLLVIDASAPGLERRGYATQDGLRAADVTLRGVRVSDAARLGGMDGLETLRRVTDEAIAATCAEAVGTMERAHEITVEYMKQRRQFGVAIGSFQALQHRAVDMLVMIEQARSMMYFATMMLSESDAVRRGAAMSAAKVQVGRSARYVGEQAVQLHGGIGVTEECSVGHYYRRLTALEVLFGDTHHHLAQLVRARGLREEPG
jgi:pimeloyl-CoA dehydrogenase small subunit